MTGTIHQNPVIANAIAADRRNRRNKKVDALTRLGVEILAVFIRGLWLMLAIGIVHHEWIPACPTISYGWAVALTSLLSAALFPFTARDKS